MNQTAIFGLTNGDVLLKSTKSDRYPESEKTKSKNPPTHDIHDSKLYRITQKRPQQKKKQGEKKQRPRALYL